MLSPQSRDNNKIVKVATMDTISLTGKGIEPHRKAPKWLPWLPRTQPLRVWTPYGLQRGTFREHDGTEQCPQVYETGKVRTGGQGRN
jgi:hypothetical protein